MKPATLPIPPVDAKRVETSRLEVQRVRDRALDEVYLACEMWPGGVVYGAVGGGLAGADAINGVVSVMRIPDMAGGGLASLIYRECRLRDLWPKTRARLTMDYTSPVGSTALFDLRFQAMHMPAGYLTTGAGAFSVTFTPAGPAVANTVLTTTVVGAVMPSLPGPVCWRIARIGGDANANALDILLAVVTMEEVA